MTAFLVATSTTTAPNRNTGIVSPRFHLRSARHMPEDLLASILEGMSQTRGRGKKPSSTTLATGSNIGLSKPPVAIGTNGVNGTAAHVKRKAVDYDEEVEGFQFSRATEAKKLKKPNATLRISKKNNPEKITEHAAESLQGEYTTAKDEQTIGTPVVEQSSSTKITLPFADTPVIQRNKEMRKEKARKGPRRSSLSLRGRRASLLIETGASNALPHEKVDAADFYKHIESDGLTEPKRMKQLLTWCATRALGDKPTGSRSEDESAKLAARVIQEELLQDFGDRPELSDWFGRQESCPPAVVIKRPNPKNVQNAEKIVELEEHIRQYVPYLSTKLNIQDQVLIDLSFSFASWLRLQLERQALAALLRPASVPLLKPKPSTSSEPEQQSSSNSIIPNLRRRLPDLSSSIDFSILHPSQQSLLATIQQQPKEPGPRPKQQLVKKPDVTPSFTSSPSVVSQRLTHLSDSLAPTLDSFAAGMHDIELFRQASHSFGGRVLRECALRLDERDADIWRGSRPLSEAVVSGANVDEGGSSGVSITSDGKEDLNPVLRALTKLERR
ncbi:hypothetical protein FQN57_005722 [Myotisia sp. PD_48]|nr:hypothetical protein FQN57_005722 [Myotisia sp. PD_48]